MATASSSKFGCAKAAWTKAVPSWGYLWQRGFVVCGLAIGAHDAHVVLGLEQEPALISVRNEQNTPATDEDAQQLQKMNFAPMAFVVFVCMSASRSTPLDSTLVCIAVVSFWYFQLGNGLLSIPLDLPE